MSQVPGEVELVFHVPFGERAAFETRDRGYLSHVSAKLPDGSVYPVFFYDAGRLAQDLEESAKHGRPYIADPGMIVVPEVTIEYMRQSVQMLARDGFFTYLKTIKPIGESREERFRWPP
jgi:hypothetical protein